MTASVLKQDPNKTQHSLTKEITPKICRLCVCVIINKCSFEPFICLDAVSTVVGYKVTKTVSAEIIIVEIDSSKGDHPSLATRAQHHEAPCMFTQLLRSSVRSLVWFG